MKNILYSLLILALISIISSCNKHNNYDDQIQTFLANDNITNPPDSFKILYKLKGYGTQMATIKFNEDAVWHIEKLTSFNSLLSIKNSEVDTASIIIYDSISLGLNQESFYYLYASNNNSETTKTLYVKFKKMITDYSSFEPKF